MSSDNSLTGTPRCPLCFERRTDWEDQTRVVHDTVGARKHTACTVCLKKLLGGGKRMKCPFCREDVLIEQQPEDLPIFVGDEYDQDSTTRNEATHLKEVVEAAMKSNCSCCGEEALYRCEDCKTYLCEDCKRVHIKAKSTKTHLVQELAELSKEERANFEEVLLCENHGLAVDMYCPKCKIPCCLKCEEHLHHKYLKLKDVLQEKEEIIKRDGKRALEKRDGIAKDTRVLNERKVAILKCKRQSRQEIKAVISTVIRNVKAQEERMLEQVSEGNDHLISWLDEEIKTREDVLEIMRVVEAYFDQKRNSAETKCLELYESIEQGLQRLDSISPGAEPVSEGEGYYFLANSNLIQNLERLNIGCVYSPRMVDDDERSSRKGSNTDISEIRVLAVGKKKSGRTQTLIALMSQEVHLNGRIKVGPGYGQWRKVFKNKIFLLSKTPGTDAAGNRNLDMERADVERVTCPGPHVLLLIIKNPDEDITCLEVYRELFQDDLLSFLILVFTGKKDLDKRRVTIQTYVNSRRDGELATVLAAVHNRFIAVNTDDKENLTYFRHNVFKMIEEVIKANDLRYLVLK